MTAARDLHLSAAATAPGDGAGSVLAASGPTLAMAVVVGVVFATGVYLLMQRSLTRILIGLTLLTHSGNLLLLVAGGHVGPVPFIEQDGSAPGGGVADPLPQAMALTAIVISFSVSALLLALAYRSYVLTRDDAVQDDVEDRRIAAAVERGERA